MKILITGVHGFVGSNLVEALKKEHTIYGLDIIAPEREGVVKTYSWEDLIEVQGSRFKVQGEGIPEVDAIIHLAGKAHDVKSDGMGQKEVYMKINCGLTIKIFDYFLAHPKCRKFIFFSTAKSAADKVDGILTEEVVPAPVGPYGESKIAAENYILNKFKEFNGLRSLREDPLDPLEQLEYLKPTSKDVYIMRPCMIHGPGNKGNLNLLYNAVRKGLPWPLGAFENKRTFTSVENVCFAVNGVLTGDVPSGIYNMGDDEPLSTNELIEEICNSLGRKPRIWKLPKGLMNGIAKVGGWLHLPLTSERLRKLTENYISSNAKIKAALGVERMPVDARTGLKRTLEAFRG
jgi:nucleoside-diphosphate-sugar epimerase